MEIGGLIAYAFKAIFGNPDIMALLLTWSIFIALVFIIYRIYEDLT